ncbi:MAG: EcsC family protein [Candidatus Krumholzibacteriia bacterium]
MTADDVKDLAGGNVARGDEMTEADLAALREAVRRLENPGFVARLTDLVGEPLEKAARFLPGQMTERVQQAVRITLEKLLDVAIRTLEDEDRRPGGTLRGRSRFHRVASGASGAVGGFFGTPALLVELPISTTIILRSIADIARSEGEDFTRVEARLSCLEVFALGGRTVADDGAETGYYAVRAALARAVTDASRHLAERGLAGKGAPVLARLVSQISARFGVVVSEKVAAQAVPVLGAIGGAGINLLFVDHFQDVARGHFTVRRLERRYGHLVVQRNYERLRDGI